jgi:hypothetical protein
MTRCSTVDADERRHPREWLVMSIRLRELVWFQASERPGGAAFDLALAFLNTSQADFA